MDLKYLIIFIISLFILSIIIFLICKLYFENKNKNLNTPLNHELNQITELKGAVSQLSSSIEERLGNFGTLLVIVLHNKLKIHKNLLWRCMRD